MALVDEPVPPALWLENRVELALPARPDLFFLARMIAGAVGSQADLELERIEDLRLAVDELLAKLLLNRPPDNTVRLTFEWGVTAVEVVATLGAPPDGTPGSDVDLAAVPGLTDASLAEELSRCVLDALVERHGYDDTGPTPVSWLRMGRSTR